jgi:hypothetical protein
MKTFNLILIFLVMFILMACPFLDIPPALAPLNKPKTSNTDFKTTLQKCRLISDGFATYQYDGSGRLTAQSPDPITKMTYDKNGFLKEVLYDFGFKGKMIFEYDGNNLLKSVSRASDGAGFTRINKYVNGVFTRQDLTNNTTGAVSSSYIANGIGQIVSTTTNSTYQYDSKGNCIKETSANGSTIEYEYDDKVNPAYNTYGFIKGQGSIYNPSIRTLIQGSAIVATTSRNNLIKIKNGATTTSYSYTYNSENLPVTRKNVLTNETINYLYDNCGSNSDLTDVSKEFSENLLIKGASRVKGDIPQPTVGEFGFTTQLTKDNVISDPYKGFNFELTSPQEFGLAFIQIDNTNEYFQIEFDETGIISQNITSSNLKVKRIPDTQLFVKGGCTFRFPSKPKPVVARVQVCNPPKKNGKLDLSKLNEKKYWCPAKKVTFNLIPFDCDLQRTSNEFIELSNLIVSPSFGVTDCQYILAKYDQLVKSMLTCKDITGSDKTLLINANNDLQAIDCSVFNNSRREIALRIKSIAKSLSIN